MKEYLLLDAQPAKTGSSGARPAMAKNMGRLRLPTFQRTQFWSKGIRMRARAGTVETSTGIAAKNRKSIPSGMMISFMKSFRKSAMSWSHPALPPQ